MKPYKAQFLHYLRFICCFRAPKIDPCHVDAHGSAVPGAVLPKKRGNLSEMWPKRHVKFHDGRCRIKNLL